jgi:hypothetical protein
MEAAPAPQLVAALPTPQITEGLPVQQHHKKK